LADAACSLGGVIETVVNFGHNDTLQIGQYVPREATGASAVGGIEVLAIGVGSVADVVGLVVAKVALGANGVIIGFAVHIYEDSSKTGSSAG